VGESSNNVIGTFNTVIIAKPIKKDESIGPDRDCKDGSGREFNKRKFSMKFGLLRIE
jgi:hypothetical protein